MPCFFPLPAMKYTDFEGNVRVKVFSCQGSFEKHKTGNNVYYGHFPADPVNTSLSGYLASFSSDFLLKNADRKIASSSCYEPLNRASIEHFTVKCSKCIGCRQDHARDWALRCEHELRDHEESCFITLTYDKDHLPENGTLVMRDLQLFFKRLRKKFGEGIRYIACGEYGDKKGRPHYHVLLFGLAFFDIKQYYRTGSKFPIYTSESLSSVWTAGNALIGDANKETAGYICRYTMKKSYSRDYGCRLPQFLTMSRRPGIGYNFIKKYFNSIFPKDYIVSEVKGKYKKFTVPSYYLRCLQKIDENLFLRVKADRTAKAVQASIDNDLTFFQTLSNKFKYALARLDLLPRVLDSAT